MFISCASDKGTGVGLKISENMFSPSTLLCTCFKSGTCVTGCLCWILDSCSLLLCFHIVGKGGGYKLAMVCYGFQLIFHGCAMTSFCNMLVVGHCLIALYSISHFISIVLSVYQIRGTSGLLQSELIIHNIILLL